MEKNEKDYKTGLSALIKNSTMQKIEDYAYQLRIKKSDVARRILEYFIEHNDVEDIQA